ncbi:hypothetical protein PSTT_06034 [Puccinia striiformis]|uniref:Uncharacterized protein n=1 Tax=Puccinia striiformis TaxID=27350 RepID=A0A2S4VLT6_9BASI|nr:hypothetical protein PSTT_06034 [Puccinia striiformis]
MEISDFITRLEKAAQVDGALGSDIAIQYQKEFQDFNIQVDNLVAYLIRVQHMLSVEEIRHSVLMCLSKPIRMAVTKELIRDNHMTLAVDGSHILPPYQIIVAYIQKELRTITILENDENLEELKVVRPSQPQPQNSLLQINLTRPYKQVVDQYHTNRTQPGIINLPPGTTIQKAEPVPEAQTSFGKLEEMEHQDHHCYDCEMAKRLRSGKEVEETPSAKKSRTEREETMDVDTDRLMDFSRQDSYPTVNPSPSGSTLAPTPNPPTPPKKVSIQAPEDSTKAPKEKAQKKTTVERPLSNQYPDAEDN